MAHNLAVLPADVAIDFWLRPIAPENMPMIAAQLLLADGYDSPALRDAAGLCARDDPRDIRSAFQQALVALSVFAARRPAAFWLIGGVITGGAGAVLSGLAPDIAAGCVGQVIGGIGNTADLVGTDTLIQQHVPQEMLGRAYGIVYGGGQLASIGSSVIAVPLVALAGARVAFVIAGVGALASLPLLLPILRRNPEPGPLLAETTL